MARPIEPQVGRTAVFKATPEIKMVITRMFYGVQPDDGKDKKIDSVNLLYLDGMGIFQELKNIHVDALEIKK